jgi:AcrR family transcriptional regulator
VHEDAQPARDGRVRRGARNRERILEALFELVKGGVLLPTAEQVAERAGVGTRTVFRHFADMESLFAEMEARLEREVRPFLEEPPAAGSLEERARALVQRRAGLFARIAPFERSGNLQRWRSAFLTQAHASMVRRLGPAAQRSAPGSRADRAGTGGRRPGAARGAARRRPYLAAFEMQR